MTVKSVRKTRSFLRGFDGVDIICTFTLLYFLHLLYDSVIATNDGSLLYFEAPATELVIAC